MGMQMRGPRVLQQPDKEERDIVERAQTSGKNTHSLSLEISVTMATSRCHLVPLPHPISGGNNAVPLWSLNQVCKY